jgi:predicted nucleotidyltransferase
MGRPDPTEILRLLADRKVEFVVVGMVAGVLRGAPVTTIDLDIVHRREAENVSRLLQVLVGLEATYRHDPRRLSPDESHLMSEGHQLLATKHGDLDCLGTVGEGRSYEDLLDRAPELTLLQGVILRVIDLPMLIELKEQAGRPKDLAALPVLRATLAETRRRG